MKIKDRAIALHKKGFAVIPVAGKAPIQQSWQQLRDERREMPNGNFERSNVTGVGIVLGHELSLGHFIAMIDVDVTHKVAARHIYIMICDVIGVEKLPFRTGQAPKFGVPVLVTERISKVRTAEYADAEFQRQHVEVLCDGQQFVAYGIHRDTNEPYKWHNGELKSTLPILTRTQVLTILDQTDAILREHGLSPDYEQTAQVKVETDPFAGLEESESSDDEIIALLKHIDADIEYDNWVKVGMALYRHYKGEAKGFALWSDWSSKGSKYQPNEMQHKWDSFASERITKLGIPTIASLARKAGADLSAIAREYKHAENELLEVYTPPTPPAQLEANTTRFVYADEFTHTLEQPQWLIKNILEHDSLAMLFGPSGAGKSYLAIDVACSIAHGHPYHGHNTKEGIVVFMVGEGARGIAARIKAWHQHHGLTPNRNLVITNKIVDMSDANDIKSMCDELHLLGITAPSLIIIDTLARASGSLDENSTKDMNIFVKNCDAIKRAMNKATVMPIHHSGKGDQSSARGSSVLRAAMDVELQVSPDQGLKFESTKMKDGEPFKPLYFKFQRINFDQVDEDGEQLYSAVLEAKEPDEINHSQFKHNDGSRLGITVLNDLVKRGVAVPSKDPQLAQTMGMDAPSTMIEYKDFKDEFLARSEKDTDDAKRKHLSRALKRMVEMEVIINRNGLHILKD